MQWDSKEVCVRDIFYAATFCFVLEIFALLGGFYSLTLLTPLPVNTFVRGAIFTLGVMGFTVGARYFKIFIRMLAAESGTSLFINAEDLKLLLTSYFRHLELRASAYVQIYKIRTKKTPHA